MLRHVIRKEFLQIRQDRRMAPIILVAPLVQLLLFGYAANLDVVEIPLVVCDQDRSATSRELVRKLEGSTIFAPVTHVEDPREFDELLTAAAAGVAVWIPPGTAEGVLRGESRQVQVLVEGSNSVTAAQGLNAVVMVTGTYATELMTRRLAAAGLAPGALPRVEPRVWYNPELKSRYYMVPAILAVILMLMTSMLTSMALVREKETGTMEQLIVTPIKPVHILLGKLLPFVLIGFVQMTVAFLGAVLWFRVPFHGSALTLYLLTVPFLLNTLGLGLLVSTVSSTQQQAMMTATFFVMMPMMYFSGFAFPVESMPAWVQPVTRIIPLTYYLEVIRGTFLRGVGLEHLWDEGVKMTVLGLAIFGVALARFRKRLD